MTIDEAIKELKDGNYLTNSEELQLAEWLEELRATSCGYSKEDIELNRNAMYNKAIDDFVKYIDECSGWTQNCIEHNIGLTVYTLHQIAKQLKAGGENE